MIVLFQSLVLIRKQGNCCPVQIYWCRLGRYPGKSRSGGSRDTRELKRGKLDKEVLDFMKKK